MKIYLFEFISYGYDEYIGFVVVAKDKEECIRHLKEDGNYGEEWQWNTGYKIKEIKASNYKKTTDILDSFNAG